MSTYLYLVCEDHDPPLFAEGESGQHLYDLPDIRRDIADRDALVVVAREDFPDFGYFRNNTVRFLMRHPKCRIGIESEYGDHYNPASEPDLPATPKESR